MKEFKDFLNEARSNTEKVAFVKNRNFVGTDVPTFEALVEYKGNEPRRVYKASENLARSKATQSSGIEVSGYEVDDYEYKNGILYLVGKDINDKDYKEDFDYKEFKKSKFGNLPVTV